MHTPKRTNETIGLAALILIYTAMSLIGFTWGLPDSESDARLFGHDPQDAIAKLVASKDELARSDAAVGADVDVNPIDMQSGATVLNNDETGQFEIYRRFRLFTHQPDEMITMMALSSMSPSNLQLDPKLYQYGGLFIYPVGALIRIAGALGITTVSSDSAHYLSHPQDFARFYWVARAYVAAWGIVGILLMFAIGKRIAGPKVGLLSATLFILLPVVTCMSHEAKPHLPGAVLMLAAVWFAMRALDRQRFIDWAGLFVSCGAAFGMVLSSAPIMILIPLALGIHCRNQHLRQVHELPTCSNRHVDYRPVFIRATAGGLIVAGLTYLITNPYIAINLFANRPVLASNFGNSMAMYEIARVPEGLWRVAQLTAEGATIPIALLGAIACIVAAKRKSRVAVPLLVAASMFALQFVLIGAGKPDEYGRFGIFYECALAVGAAWLIVNIASRSRAVGVLLGVAVCAWCGFHAAGYLWSFHVDATNQGSRTQAAAQLDGVSTVAVIAEPAPYACPPINFAETPVTMYRNSPDEPILERLQRWIADEQPTSPPTMIAIIDNPSQTIDRLNLSDEFKTEIFENRPNWLPRGKISWANKPVLIIRRNHK
ncbi:MAG TPA: glycosyltransferase family 39 protein [Phycisphaerae bacterium]|nr:glycosyltransferase family 39 protein [Phycisphaerae bacterium]